MIRHEVGSIAPGRDGKFRLPCCRFRVSSLPAECSCDENGQLTTKTEDSRKFSTCRHRGESTGEIVQCGCPSSEKQMVYWCELYATTCMRNAGTRETHRSCLACFENEEGWEG